MSLAKAIKIASCTVFVFLQSESDNVLLVLSATRYGKLETETENSKHRRHGFSNLLAPPLGNPGSATANLSAWKDQALLRAKCSGALLPRNPPVEKQTDQGIITFLRRTTCVVRTNLRKNLLNLFGYGPVLRRIRSIDQSNLHKSHILMTTK